MMFELSINVEEELTRLLGTYEIIIPSSVQQELEILSQKGNGKRAHNARAAIKLISRYRQYPTKIRPVDESISMVAQELNASVLTNDKALRKQLLEKNITVIYLRGKHILQME